MEYHLEDLRYENWYQIRSNEIDKTKRMNASALIQLLQETAMQHVIRLKISALELEPMGLGWALIQQSIRIFRRPLVGERVRVLTYPCGKQRVFTFRDFHMFDEAGRKLAEGSTTWLLMDLRTRGIARFPEHIEQMIAMTEQQEHLARPEKVPTRLDAPTRTRTFEVLWHDLDFNGHLTNAFFTKWMLETVPVEILETHELEALHIKFQGEALLGDVITGKVAPIDAGTYLHLLVKGDQDLAYGRSEWMPRPE